MTRARALLLAIAALLLLLAALAPGFYSFANVRDLLLTNVPVLIAALGMTLVILVGQIDISIGAQFAVASFAIGSLAQAGLPTVLLPLAAGIVGALLGAINGVLVAFARIPSIVVTLALMVVLRDGLRWTTNGAWVQDLPASFQWFGLGQAAGQLLILLLAGLLFAAFAWALRYLALGRALYAIGADPEAARLLGLRVRPLLCGVFCAMGVLTAWAALLSAVRFRDVPSNAGVGLELRAIAAVVVGGASINGGRGTAGGTLLGVALLALIGPALTFLGVSATWEQALQGAIILAAVLTETLAARAGGSHHVPARA